MAHQQEHEEAARAILEQIWLRECRLDWSWVVAMQDPLIA